MELLMRTDEVVINNAVSSFRTRLNASQTATVLTINAMDLAKAEVSKTFGVSFLPCFDHALTVLELMREVAKRWTAICRDIVENRAGFTTASTEVASDAAAGAECRLGFRKVGLALFSHA